MLRCVIAQYEFLFYYPKHSEILQPSSRTKLTENRARIRSENNNSHEEEAP